jgi:hypothetical protein
VAAKKKVENETKAANATVKVSPDAKARSKAKGIVHIEQSQLFPSTDKSLTPSLSPLTYSGSDPSSDSDSSSSESDSDSDSSDNEADAGADAGSKGEHECHYLHMPLKCIRLLIVADANLPHGHVSY